LQFNLNLEILVTKMMVVQTVHAERQNIHMRDNRIIVLVLVLLLLLLILLLVVVVVVVVAVVVVVVVVPKGRGYQIY